jgi:hypothetical protein
MDIDWAIHNLCGLGRITFRYNKVNYVTELIKPERITSRDEYYDPNGDIYRVTIMDGLRISHQIYYSDKHKFIARGLALDKSAHNNAVRMIGEILPQPIAEEVVPNYRLLTTRNLFHMLTLFEFVEGAYDEFRKLHEIHKIKVASCRRQDYLE